MLNIDSTLIQLDFDNTLTIGNVSELIHDQFGPENWEEVYAKYLDDLITVDESNIFSFKVTNYFFHIFIRNSAFRNNN